MRSTVCVFGETRCGWWMCDVTQELCGSVDCEFEMEIGVADKLIIIGNK